MRKPTPFQKWIKRYAGDWFYGWPARDVKLVKAAFLAGYRAGRKSKS